MGKVLLRVISVGYILFGVILMFLAYFGARFSMDFSGDDFLEAYEPFAPQLLLALAAIVAGFGLWKTKKWAYALAGAVFLFFVLDSQFTHIIIVF